MPPEPSATSAARPSGRPTDRGEATRRHILDAAAAVFARRGYAAASLNELITEMGLTKGGFYFHFPSKESLAIEVLRAKQERWAVEVMAVAGRHARAVDQLTAIPDALLDLYESDPSARAVPRLTIDLSSDRRLVADMADLFAMWVDLAAGLVRSAQAEGDIRDDVDPVAVAEGAVAAFVGLEQMAALAAGGSDLRARAERFTGMYLTILRAPGRSGPARRGRRRPVRRSPGPSLRRAPEET